MNAGDNGVVVFDNLGRDALLVVPSPVDASVDYRDLAAFLKDAPSSQKHALWRTVGRYIHKRIGNLPLWVSIAGGGIAWIHIRLDTRAEILSLCTVSICTIAAGSMILVRAA